MATRPALSFRHAIACGLAAMAGLAGCGRQPVRASQPPTAPNYPAANQTVATGKDAQKEHPVPESVRSSVDALRILPAERLVSTEEGLASWYGTIYNRRRGADGSVYDQDALTAASRTLPLGVLARVTNLSDGQTVVVRITDRGPFVPGRILDLSRAAARAVGLDRAGVGKVRVEAYAVEGSHATPAKWCVQIGAFADPDDARQLRNDLLLHYQTAKVISFDGPTGSWVRLTLSVPEDKDRNAEVAAAVRVPDPGVEAYVTRIN